MVFGIYIHIPFCLQKCHYCDFITLGLDQGISRDEYKKLVQLEIQQRSASVPYKKIDSIYFGGGTPSLMPPKDIVSLISEFAKQGFYFSSNSEITIEINPGTLSESDLNFYLENGVNRFSVGAQTFKESLLKSCRREHGVAETYDTLNLLKKYDVNFTMDILYSLPGQTLDDLKADLDLAMTFNPKHISSYNLNVPKGHPMQKGRPNEVIQEHMFTTLEDHLKQYDFNRYEISNFAKAGFESKHNLIYWSDQPYWGLGLSSHSYFHSGDWGQRFWNPPNLKRYQEQVTNFTSTFLLEMPAAQIETLQLHEAMTDYCHISLRKKQGLLKSQLKSKFPDSAQQLITRRLKDLEKIHWIKESDDSWSLTQKGQLLSNKVFFELTFTCSDLTN